MSNSHLREHPQVGRKQFPYWFIAKKRKLFPEGGHTQLVEPGPYNLASENVTIGAVADFVAARFQVPCIEVDQPTRYDMAVSTDKFTHATGMAFTDTVASLVEELAMYYTQIPLSA
jgi:hypothetical protein